LVGSTALWSANVHGAGQSFRRLRAIPRVRLYERLADAAAAAGAEWIRYSPSNRKNPSDFSRATALALKLRLPHGSSGSMKVRRRSSVGFQSTRA
jgi:hypothetical protein